MGRDSDGPTATAPGAPYVVIPRHRPARAPLVARPPGPPSPTVDVAGVHVDPAQLAAVLVLALHTQQISVDQAIGVLDVAGVAQHLPEATRRRLLLDAMRWHGMTEDLAAGAYQVVATLDPTPRPDVLLGEASGFAGDLRDALLAELTGQA
jgi:hypothetical protein